MYMFFTSIPYIQEETQSYTREKQREVDDFFQQYKEQRMDTTKEMTRRYSQLQVAISV